jgi:hypothetical protein
MFGVWVYGDNSGALLNLQLGIPRGTNIDHYVDLDFEGWRYFEFPWCEGSRVFDYEWPYTWKHSLVSVRWREIDRFSLYLNAIPAKRSATCGISAVKALKMIDTSLVNPWISVGGKKITFPVVLNPDEYLEYFGGKYFKHFGKNGELVGRLHISGEVPEIFPGANDAIFGAEESASAIVTVIKSGPRLTE